MAQTRIEPSMDWVAFQECLLECGRRWGNLQARKPTWAVYSPSSMPGSGMPPIPGGEYFNRFPVHFRCAMESSAFSSIVALLQVGVSTEEQAVAMCSAMTTLRKLVPGMLGDYHYKMLWGLTIVSQWFLARFVRTYSVSKVEEPRRA